MNTHRLRDALTSWIRSQSVAVPEPEPLESPTPIYVSHRTRTIILFVLVGIFAYISYRVPTVLSTVFMGATLALILSFPVRFLQRFVSRGKSIAIVTLGMIGGAVVTLLLLIPFLVSEIGQFTNNFPETLENITSFFERMILRFNERGWIDERPEKVINDIQTSLMETTQTLVSGALGNVVKTLTATFSVLITMFGVIFVAVYLLVDIPSFRKSYVRMWAPDYRHDAIVLWDTIGFSLSRYLGTLAISLALQGVLAFIGLWLLGVPYALFLGLVVSVTAILPFVGAWISAIPAVLVALTVSWQTAVGVAILYVVINQLEGNVITPKLQGDAVRVHPILIFFGVIGGSQLFGIVGAILAVPAIAVLRVVIEFFWLRLRVAEDRPTLLSAMRFDRAEERIGNQSPIAEEMEEEEVTPAEIAEAVEPEDADGEPDSDHEPVLDADPAADEPKETGKGSGSDTA